MNQLSKQGWLTTFRSAGVVCFVVMALVCLGAGCASLPEIHLSSPTVPETSVSSTWHEVGEGIERLESHVAIEDIGARFLIYRFTKNTVTWKVATSTVPKTMLAWADEFPKASLVLNAGYFHEDGLPSGFVVAGGTRVGNRTFDVKRSNLLTLDPWPAITTPSSLKAIAAKEALQSYPLLIKQGQAAIDKETSAYGRRTFIGVDSSGTVYVGFVPYESISLYQFSRLLMRLPITWQTVLNLDGGSSTGFVYRSPSFEERVESFATIPYVIVVEAK